MVVEEKKVILKNGKEILIRSPLSSEAENMLIHLRQSHSESYKNLNQSADYWINFKSSEEEKILEDFRQSKSKFMIAAIDNGKIIGGLGVVGNMAGFSRHSAGLGMSIQKAYCGLGIGTELMKHAIYSAKALGFTRMELTVRTYNEAGIKLYEKVGFQRIGTLKNMALIDGEFADEFSYQLIMLGKQ